MDSEIDIDGDGEATGEDAAAGEATNENADGKSDAAAGSIACRSCGNPVAGPFCSFCGQKDDDLRRSSFVLASEFMRDTFGFDSRMWRTLGLLAIAPGLVPSNYAHGKRSRFTPPVRLFLVVSFIFFLTLSLTQTLFLAFDLSFERTDTAQTETAEALETVAPTAEAAIDDAVARVEERLDAEDGAVDESVADENAVDEGAADDAEGEEHGAISLTTNEENCPTAGSLRFFVKASELAPVEHDLSQCLVLESQSDLTSDQEQNYNTLARITAGVVFALEKPLAFNASFNAWLPRVMFFMTPMLALILAMFIRGKDALLFDHLVLSLYSHAAGFAIVGLAVVLTQLGVPQVGPIATVAIFAYFVAALRRGYGRGWIKTLWTASMASFLYIIILFSAVMYIVSQIIWRAAV